MSSKHQHHITLTSFLHLRYLFLLLAIVVLCLNGFESRNEIIKMQKVREKIPYIFLGLKFSGLKDILQGVQYIGYYTDKDLDDQQDASQFAQAQYILAPVILDLNNTQHPFILFDCSTQEIAEEKIKELGVHPIRKNQFGIILAKNPNPQPLSSKTR